MYQLKTKSTYKGKKKKKSMFNFCKKERKNASFWGVSKQQVMNAVINTNYICVKTEKIHF